MAQDVDVVVGADDQARLEAVVSDRNRPQKHVQRARIVLTCAEQPTWSDRRVAAEVSCSAGQVRKWRKRWCETKNLQEAARSGRPRVFSP